jgi:tetratricopeptide (TPR) repeat protein
MNGFKEVFIVAVLTAAPGFAQQLTPQVAQVPQTPQVPQVPQVQFDIEGKLAQAEEQLARAGKALALVPDLKGLDFNMASLLNKTGTLAFQAQSRFGANDGEYDRGTRALDDRKYDDAVRRFDAVINNKSPRADGALYWKAYALNRVGRRDDALAALATLRRDYPNSHWLNDAMALEAEVRQGNGQAASPGQETNEDLKLMAINSLMNADPDRAIPLLEGILKGNSTPKVKDRALFVLTQNRSPRAQQVLAEYARGQGNPDLQVRAIRYIGISGTVEAQQQLGTIYNASTDPGIKTQIIQSMSNLNAKEWLVTLAKSEKNDERRATIFRQLGAMRATDDLGQLYASETSVDNKVQIVRSLFAAGASDKLLEIARTEKEPRVRDEAIRNLAMSRSASPETLAGLYASGNDVAAKKAVVNGLMARGDAKPLVDLARRENDPTMKKYIVGRLATMHSKEATDYMMELLK